MRKNRSRLLSALLALVMLASLATGAAAAGIDPFYSILARAGEGGEVIASTNVVVAGGNATVSIMANEGYVIDYIDINGNKFVPGSPIVEWITESYAKFTFQGVIGDQYLIAYFRTPDQPGTELPEETWDNPYSDVQEGEWSYDGVRYVTENHLMNAKGPGLFGAGDLTTRGEVVLALWNLGGQSMVTKVEEYLDVPEGDAHYWAVAWCRTHGIVQGFPDGTFGADGLVTREQFAAFLYRYAEYIKLAQPTEQPLEFTDADRINAYALPAVAFMTEKGVINGRGDGTFDPTGSATRAEAAAMLARFAQLS